MAGWGDIAGTILNYVGEAADTTTKISNAVNSFNNHTPAPQVAQAPTIIQQTTSPTSKYMEYGAILIGVGLLAYFIIHKK